MRVDSGKLRKLLILNIPYLVFGLICTNFGEAWRMAEGINASEKILSFFFNAWNSVCLSASEFSHAGFDDRSDLWCLF